MLVTLSADGSPHPVPVTFAFDGDRVFTAIDHKPKSTRRLARLTNIERDPRVALLVHHYSEDWADLWWCRLEGKATIQDDGPTLRRAQEVLEAKYEQYAGRPPEGPAIVIDVTAWSGWQA